MNAEDIIQHKEWQQLSADEKAEILELAATEAEFNLLKQMLAVSMVDEESVPTLDPAVKSVIDNELYPAAKSRNHRFWYAAAAVLVVGLAITFLLQPAMENGSLVANDPVAQTQLKLIPKEVIPDSTNLIVNQQPDPVKQKKQIPAPAVDTNDLININQSDVAINTTIEANTGLLSLVTEVY